MIKVVFKNVDRSELARELATERVQAVIERFPDLLDHKITITLSMENSPIQAGPDVFTVKLFIEGKRYKSVVIQKSAGNLYAALADVMDNTLERLNRYGDKKRVKRRSLARKIPVGETIESSQAVLAE